MELTRFLIAQINVYEAALGEIKNGQKQSHWMWYIFPQLKGLGKSSSADFYGIEGAEGAKAYLNHPILGARLKEITGEILKHQDKTTLQIFGSPDTLKLRSCMTLFKAFSEENSVFEEVLKAFYDGLEDRRTVLKLESK